MGAAAAPLPPVRPRPEILQAVEETALRYAGDPALRAAGLSVTEWIAFFRATIEVESAYDPEATSAKGAVGLGQLMPETAQDLGVDRADMYQNLDGSARTLLQLLAAFQDKELALAGYNAGPEAVRQHGGIPPYPETIGHVAKVMAVYRHLTL